MKATKEGNEYNYTGYACYMSALGVWIECEKDFKKGSALGFFDEGSLVSLIRSNVTNDRFLFALKF